MNRRDDIHRVARFAIVSAAVGLLLLAPHAGFAQASPYVPVLDQAYDDLDALVIAGWVHEIIQAQRPYSRLGFASFAGEARAARDAAGPGEVKARFDEALERLEGRFSAEIAALCLSGEADCVQLEAYATIRQVSADATMADSPPRAVPTLYDQPDGDFIDAVINPLLQGNQGRLLADGWTGGAEGIFDLMMGPRIAAQVSPRVWIAEGVDGQAEPHVTLLQAYARGVFGKLALDVGRNHVPRGHARGGGPVVSLNPRGMDLVRLSFDRPVRLPWIFGRLGPMGASAYVADMGTDRDRPHSKLFVFEASVRPHPNLELGATLLNHQGGGVAPEIGWLDRVLDIFLIKPQGEAHSDKVIGFDGLLTLPGPGLELYFDVMTTDDHELFRFVRQALWEEAAWNVGAKRTGIGAEGRIDLWVEGHRSGVRAYTHHQFTSGLTLDGRVIGDGMGPLGTGVQAGLGWTAATESLVVIGAWERYQGDIYWNPPGDGGLLWHRLEDNPDEIRLRATLDWTRHAEVTGLRTTVRLGYEHVTRFDFTDENRSNFMVQVRAEYVR